MSEATAGAMTGAQTNPKTGAKSGAKKAATGAAPDAASEAPSDAEPDAVAGGETAAASGSSGGQAAALPVELRRRILRFDRLVASYIHPERLARLLPATPDAAARRALLGRSRIERRLSAWLVRKLALARCAPADFADAERRIALLDPPALAALVRRAGAIWHGHRLREVITREARAELTAWLGEDAYRCALEHGDLAMPAAPLVAPEDLRQAVEQDGRLCLAAWCAAQPPAIAARIELKLPPLPAPQQVLRRQHEQRGPLIIRRLAFALADGAPGDG